MVSMGTIISGSGYFHFGFKFVVDHTAGGKQVLPDIINAGMEYIYQGEKITGAVQVPVYPGRGVFQVQQKFWSHMETGAQFITQIAPEPIVHLSCFDIG